MDYDEIEEIVSILRDSSLTEVEVRQGDRTLRLRRPAPPSRFLPVDLPVPVLNGENYGTTTAPAAVMESTMPVPVAVTAGLVGVFRTFPEPVIVGAWVEERQILGHVESMGLVSDSLAPIAGRVTTVHVEDGQPVEYGQTLFEIVPEAAGENAG